MHAHLLGQENSDYITRTDQFLAKKTKKDAEPRGRPKSGKGKRKARSMRRLSVMRKCNKKRRASFSDGDASREGSAETPPKADGLPKAMKSGSRRSVAKTESSTKPAKTPKAKSSPKPKASPKKTSAAKPKASPKAKAKCSGNAKGSKRKSKDAVPAEPKAMKSSKAKAKNPAPVDDTQHDLYDVDAIDEIMSCACGFKSEGEDTPKLRKELRKELDVKLSCVHLNIYWTKVRTGLHVTANKRDYLLQAFYVEHKSGVVPWSLAMALSITCARIIVTWLL